MEEGSVRRGMIAHQGLCCSLPPTHSTMPSSRLTRPFQHSYAQASLLSITLPGF